jgi:hypothetical protein
MRKIQMMRNESVAEAEEEGGDWCVQWMLEAARW